MSLDAQQPTSVNVPQLGEFTKQQSGSFKNASTSKSLTYIRPAGGLGWWEIKTGSGQLIGWIELRSSSVVGPTAIYNFSQSPVGGTAYNTNKYGGIGPTLGQVRLAAEPEDQMPGMIPTTS